MTEEAEAQKYLLISGEFYPDEANEVLMTLINNKISFHQTHNWSRRERGESDAVGRKRIEQLTETKAKLGELMEEAGSIGQRIGINCTIDITVLAP